MARKDIRRSASGSRQPEPPQPSGLRRFVRRLFVWGLGLALLGVAWMSLDAHAIQDWKAILVAVFGSCAWAITTVIAQKAIAIPRL